MAAQELLWTREYMTFMDHCDKFSPALIDYHYTMINGQHQLEFDYLMDEYDRLGELPSISLVSSPGVWYRLRYCHEKKQHVRTDGFYSHV